MRTQAKSMEGACCLDFLALLSSIRSPESRSHDLDDRLSISNRCRINSPPIVNSSTVHPPQAGCKIVAEFSSSLLLFSLKECVRCREILAVETPRWLR